MCSSCGSSLTSQKSQYSSKIARGSQIVSEPCSYTLEQVENWLAKVKCYRDKELYVNTNITKKLLNKYISRLEAAKHYSTNICFFEKKLKEVENFIIVVTSTGQC